jgi:hypothetical protein
MLSKRTTFIAVMIAATLVLPPAPRQPPLQLPPPTPLLPQQNLPRRQQGLPPLKLPPQHLP